MAPKLVTEAMIKTMRPGSVVVDVAIDQGGSFETTAGKPTTHHEPTFEKHGVIHYAVANIPGAVPVTSTYALTNATLPFAVELADKAGKTPAATILPSNAGSTRSTASAPCRCG